ncbi:hypothetical protein CFC21_082320, partial [Triticum aestivum]
WRIPTRGGGHARDPTASVHVMRCGTAPRQRHPRP